MAAVLHRLGRVSARHHWIVIGVGLAVAIAIDATLVRCLLVPAIMVSLGDASWWLARSLPEISIEGESSFAERDRRADATPA